MIVLDRCIWWNHDRMTLAVVYAVSVRVFGSPSVCVNGGRWPAICPVASRYLVGSGSADRRGTLGIRISFFPWLPQRPCLRPTTRADWYPVWRGCCGTLWCHYDAGSYIPTLIVMAYDFFLFQQFKQPAKRGIARESVAYPSRVHVSTDQTRATRSGR